MHDFLFFIFLKLEIYYDGLTLVEVKKLNQILRKTRGVSHCGLTIYIKNYLKAK
jgi:hypothetical protein